MGKHAIIVIKNKENKYLQKYIESWNSFLFLNCKIEDSNDITPIRKLLLEELNVKDIDITYVNNIIHEKFSEKDKIMKEYNHFFFLVTINEDYKINDNYKWYSYDEFLKDDRIMEVNSDIIGFIKELNL